MNMEDFKKLTVADLKKELKARNLPVSGNKTELLQRLSDHISSNYEHQILDQQGRIDESLLEGVQEDEVLGISTGIPVASAVTSPSGPPKKVQLKKESSQLVPESKSTVETTSVTAKAPAGDGTTDNSSTEKEPAARKIRLKSSISSEGETTAKPAAKISLSSINPDQAKLERAKKFNVPLSETDRKNIRAERFGTDTKSKATAASVSASKPAVDASTLEKRSQRFGTSIGAISGTSSQGNGQGDEKLKQRAERFGMKTQSQGANGVGGSGADKEKLMKRQLRFGGGSASGGDGEATEKKKARAERFGTGGSK